MPPSFQRFNPDNINTKAIKKMAEDVIPKVIPDAQTQDQVIKSVQNLPTQINEQDLLHSMSADLSKALVGGNVQKNPNGEEAQKTGADGKPKSFFFDPYGFTDSLSHKNQISGLSYSTLAEMSKQAAPVGAVINTRLNQMFSFSRVPRDRYGIGFRIELEEPKKKMSDSEKKEAKEIEKFILNLGKEEAATERDHFGAFLKKVGRDSLTYDQINFERVFTYGGKLHEIASVDAASIRIALRKYLNEDDPKKDVIDSQIISDRGRGIGRTSVPLEKKAYLQVVNSQVITEYTEEEMAFSVRWPRTDLRSSGYGFSEIEQLISTITAILFAGEYNRRFFSAGSSPKGILNVKGNMSQPQLDSFKRAWLAQLSGLSGAWRTPIVAAEGGLEFISTDKTNREMEFSKYQDFLIKMVCAIFAMSPEEINFTSTTSSSGQGPMFESKSEMRLKASRDKGLVPLLMHFENMMNREIIRFINPKYRFVFVGLDGGTEADRIEMNIKRLKYYTLDELRASEDMEPLENGMGKIVDNTSFLQVYLEQMKEKQAEKMAKKQQDFTMKQGDVDFQRQQDMAQEQQKFEAEQALEQQKQELDAQKEQAKTEKKANKAAKKVQKSLTDNTWDLDDQEALTDEIQKGLQTGDFSKAVGMINDEKVVINLEV
jgi:hypothetical protein